MSCVASLRRPRARQHYFLESRRGSTDPVQHWVGLEVLHRFETLSCVEFLSAFRFSSMSLCLPLAAAGKWPQRNVQQDTRNNHGALAMLTGAHFVETSGVARKHNAHRSENITCLYRCPTPNARNSRIKPRNKAPGAFLNAQHRKVATSASRLLRSLSISAWSWRDFDNPCSEAMSLLRNSLRSNFVARFFLVAWSSFVWKSSVSLRTFLIENFRSWSTFSGRAGRSLYCSTLMVLVRTQALFSQLICSYIPGASDSSDALRSGIWSGSSIVRSGLGLESDRFMFVAA